MCGPNYKEYRIVSFISYGQHSVTATWTNPNSWKILNIFRRSDKIALNEAGFHKIEEYMEQVELWFIKYEMSHPPTKRRIYLASDDPQVKTE